MSTNLDSLFVERADKKQRSAKKQKRDHIDLTDPVINEPTIFTVSKHKPDTRIFVFGKEFHVYSGILNLNASFFNVKPEPSSDTCEGSRHEFKSEWYIALNDDLGWVLTCDPKCKTQPNLSFKGDMLRERKAFNNLLCAIFRKDYQITDAVELNAMTTQAEYYGALRAMSNTISATFFNSPGLLETIGKDPCTILNSAYKLRHALLFKECFVHVLGPWSNPRFKKLSDPLLRSLAAKSYNAIFHRVSTTHLQLLQLAADHPSIPPPAKQRGTTIGAKIFDLAPTSLSKGKDKKIRLPLYFRQCFEEDFEDCLNEDIEDAQVKIKGILEPLLTNDFVLDKTAVSGKCKFADYFLCCNVKDEDLPWANLSQDDW